MGFNAHAYAEKRGEIGGGDEAHTGGNGGGVRCGCGRKKEGKKKRGPHLAAGREGRERERVECLAVGSPSDGHGRAGRVGEWAGGPRWAGEGENRVGLEFFRPKTKKRGLIDL